MQMIFRIGFVITLVAGVASCSSPGQPESNAVTPASPPAGPQPVNGYPFVSAHRGGAAYAPENTMIAFRNAVRLGVDELEADAQLTSDGVLILLHDDTLDRTTECSGTVISMTLAEVQNCDAAYWFSPGQRTTRPDMGREHPLRGQGVVAPQLAELFAYMVVLGEASPFASIEIKNIPNESNFDPTGTQVATPLVALIQSFGLQDKVVVQSFFPTSLNVVKQLDPSIRTQFLTTSEIGITASNNLAFVVSNGHDIAAPNYDAPDFTAEFVQTAQAAGKLVVPYTTDTALDIQATAALGVDGLITNYPACMLVLAGRPVASSVLAPEVGGDPNFAFCP